ncbi:feruloyl-CoA synthase [Ramlibacter rhizophilus]|uniref:Feruloyl-CoA synthase n=1 Tax=Ramlibacter rhizophilus TaxID=1781167 RepID=A0A4Z0BDK1_9BURK|nr:feruloyl-CoA synthase [Ramlibacter rhizophilus]TFY97395.1 feruloyl-CoA synthase [Ramlibacter rhizophilus]
MALQWMADAQQLAPPRTLIEARADGSQVLRSPEPLQPYARCVGEWIEHWAAATPGSEAFSQRDAAGQWQSLSWKETRERIGRIGQWLLDRRLAPGAPLVVLSDNSLDHLLLMLAAMHVGIPHCTVSSAYCRLTRDYAKIRAILQALQPGLIYAADAATYGPAIAASGLRVPTVFSEGAQEVEGAIPFARLLDAREGPAVRAAYEAITPDSHAKYLLTSGSTGHPKVVVNTHRMLCANQQMMAQVWRFLEHEKPVLVDWLPWSHTFGTNHNLNMVLRGGGTLVIDEGRPAPGLVEKTLRNLAEKQPTLWFNVPRGFELALPLLESDEELARAVFARLRVIFYAGAALAPSTWARLSAVARRVRGEEVWLTTSWGATETAPAVTSAHWALDGPGVIGNVLPGMELKLVPNGEKLEMRVRGVSVFPGYRNAPELNAQAFDEEGFYRIGDAGYLADPAHPERGVVFDGRVAEDFKLGTGTWVSAGTLRIKVVSALAPLAQDVVVTGHDRSEVGVLVFPSAAAANLDRSELARRVAEGLGRLRAEGGGSSQCPARALILSEPPSADAGEITDKGYINQRAVLARRADAVEALYAGGDGVIVPA